MLTGLARIVCDLLDDGFFICLPLRNQFRINDSLGIVFGPPGPQFDQKGDQFYPFVVKRIVLHGFVLLVLAAFQDAMGFQHF